MMQKSLALFLVGFVLVVGADAQTPAPGAKDDLRTFSMFFDSDGAYLGVQTTEVTKDNFSKYGLGEVRGVAIEKVVEGSPAEKAGLQNGDVIVRLGNEEVTSVRKLTRLLGEVSPDHQVKVTVVRGGSEREIVATVGKRPMLKFNEGGFAPFPSVPFPQSPEFPPMPKIEGLPRVEALPPGAPDRPSLWTFGSGRRIGVGVTTLTKQLSDHFGVPSGVMINDVRADSPAARAGLKAGDIIVEVEGREVKSDGDLIRAIAEKRDGDVTLTIIRDRNRQTVRVTPENIKEGFHTFDFPSGDSHFKFAMPVAPMPITKFRFPGRVL